MRKSEVFNETHRHLLKQARILLLTVIDPMTGIHPMYEEKNTIEDLAEEIEHLLGY